MVSWFLFFFDFRFDVLFVLSFVDVDHFFNLRHYFTEQHCAVLDLAQFFWNVDIFSYLNWFFTGRNPLAFFVLSLLNLSVAFVDGYFVIHAILDSEFIASNRTAYNSNLVHTKRSCQTGIFQHMREK